jgi:hypothetical protein
MSMPNMEHNRQPQNSGFYPVFTDTGLKEADIDSTINKIIHNYSIMYFAYVARSSWQNTILTQNRT